MQYVVTVLMLFMLLGGQSGLQAQSHNRIETGIAIIKTSFSFPVDSVCLNVLMQEILTEKQQVYKYVVSGHKRDEVHVPVSLTQQVGRITVQFDSIVYFDGLIGLHQEVPLCVAIQSNEKEETVCHISGGMGFSEKDATSIGNVVAMFHGTHSVVSSQVYSDWKTYLQTELDSIFPARMKLAMEGISLTDVAKKWVTNGLTTLYVGGRLFTYKSDALRWGGVSVPDPPLSYYSFLKDQHFSSAIMLSDNIGLMIFLRFFLHTPSFSIQPIQNSEVAVWIKSLQDRLEPVIGDFPVCFYDLLAAVSYLEQIEEGATFTEFQKQNLSRYFQSGLGTILLRENEKLERLNASKRNSRIIHFSNPDNTPILKQLLKRYQGCIVVVDLWNTWCGPCRDAHKLIEPLKVASEFSNVVFVYFADESSPLKVWKQAIKSIRGDHYYLTKKEMENLMQECHTTVFPSYLIFDRKHQLQKTFQGFPGIDIFKKEIP